MSITSYIGTLSLYSQNFNFKFTLNTYIKYIGIFVRQDDP